MSLLTNLSHASEAPKKPDRGNTVFAGDYGKAHSTIPTEAQSLAQPNQAHTGTQSRDGTSQKARPTPVVQVDPFEVMEPDEYGAELGKEARVWKVYVKETDRWDAELVDGWNKFLVESSKMLKQDPNDVSAAALVSISQTMVAIARNASLDFPTSTTEANVTSSFVPSHRAVLINTLWYLSLSLSVATSFLAMLAKDWCHSFATNRTGHPWDQALRRQRKWCMIERWKMQELITVLPSLIHLSLAAAPHIITPLILLTITVFRNIISLLEEYESCVLYRVSLSKVVEFLSVVVEFLQKCRGNFSSVLWKVIMWLKSESTHHQATQLHGNHEDQMKSLALKWLIQNCETPSSISIALQAIAGASSRIPTQPLRECEATLHILRRLALNSTASPDE
ncbi:hypothetical protein FRC11_001109, partial [Ceratobasidium sp. 423]